MLCITNANIITMEGQNFENGYLLARDAKIAAVGAMDGFEAPAGAQVFDAKGAFLVPGFVDCHCHIGLGVGSRAFSQIKFTDNILHKINARDPYFQRAAASGITTVVCGPGSFHVLGGMFCALHTRGKNLADMVLKNPAAVKFAMGENTGASTKKAAGQIAAALSASSALRRLPVKVHAHKKEDLLAANALAKGKNLFLTLEHATDAHLVSDKLSHVSGICAGPLLTDISKDELLNLTPSAAGILHGAGFCVSICSDHPETPVNYLQLYACLAAKEGLTPFAALAAITINAAKNCGLEGLVGSLAPGKRADCCLFSGHPIRFGSRLLRVVINGQFCI